MKRLVIFVLSTWLFIPAAVQAAPGESTFYSNLGATLISNDSHNESAYFVELGYSHRFDWLLSADFNYKKVETFDSKITAGSDEFVQTYDSYGIGIRADQQLGALSVFAKAGASFITSEITTWDSTTSAEITDKDNSLKPYASAGLNLASPYDKRITFGAAVTYQMLPNNEYSTSFSSGVNYAF